MSIVWKLAQENLEKAQGKQKRQHVKFAVGDRVFVNMAAIHSGPAYKLTRPYEGPYQVIATHLNGVELQSVQQPKAKPIRVALNRVRKCPVSLADNEEVVVEQANGEEDEDSNSLDHEQSGITPDEEMEKDLEEVAQHSKEEQKKTLPGSWGSRLRPQRSQGRLQT